MSQFTLKEVEMEYRLLDCVVLINDKPRLKLRAGDLGTVVEVYKPGGLEIEFVKASGETLAVVTLSKDEIRPVKPEDIVSVRSLSHVA